MTSLAFSSHNVYCTKLAIFSDPVVSITCGPSILTAPGCGLISPSAPAKVKLVESWMCSTSLQVDVVLFWSILLRCSFLVSVLNYYCIGYPWNLTLDCALLSQSDVDYALLLGENDRESIGTSLSDSTGKESDALLGRLIRRLTTVIVHHVPLFWTLALSIFSGKFTKVLTMFVSSFRQVSICSEFMRRLCIVHYFSTLTRTFWNFVTSTNFSLIRPCLIQTNIFMFWAWLLELCESLNASKT